MDRARLKSAGKYLGLAAVGAGVGAAGTSVADDDQSSELQNLEEKIDQLESDRSELEDQLEQRPSQEVVDELEATVEQKNERIDSLFTQEEVDDVVAEATEREGLVDYVPVVVDEDIELAATSAEVDGHVDEPAMEHYVSSPLDLEDEEGEEYDELRVDYEHDEDGHEYRVLVRSFEDGEDAYAYQEAVEDAVEDADHEEDPGEDAYVYRDGDVVVYVHGEAGGGDYGSYDFRAIQGQY